MGIELQTSYLDEARRTGAEVLHANIFDLNLHRDLPWKSEGPLLVIGNPPWVTAADLSTFNSINTPPKSNIRNLRGIEALTGASNFDIAEYIWIKLIVELGQSQPHIALLCKTQVARNVLTFCHQNGIQISNPELRRVDAKAWFGASVDACLFSLSVGGDSDWDCPIYPSLEAVVAESVMGFSGGKLVADVESLRSVSFADGESPIEWRQGVKHDATAVMELAVDDDGKLTNGLGEVVDVEAEYVYPLLKGTDIFRDRLNGSRRVIVTQRSLAEDTALLSERAPRLWAYLQDHGDVLDNRKSTIYRSRPRFSMFGVGPYSFAPWKVAVSGFHSDPEFRVVGPVGGKPVLVDDTCYFLPFDSRVDAVLTGAALMSPTAQTLLRSLTFPDSKRPITKRLLQRIDLGAILKHEDRSGLVTLGSSTGAPYEVEPTLVDLVALESRLDVMELTLPGI